MTNKCYSYDEEYFHADLDTPLERAVENFLDDNPDFEGETEIELFEGKKIPFKISDFLGTNIADVLCDTACDSDEGGENAEGWAGKILKNSGEIQKLVSAALENWANETNNQPNFFGVKNVESFSVKIKVDKEGNWEHIQV